MPLPHVPLSVPDPPDTPPCYAEGEAVRLLITQETPLGFKALINETHWGLLYHSELSVPLRLGQETAGFVRRVLPSGKIDLRLDPAGYQRVGPLSRKILHALQTAGGYLPFDDQSTPETIREAFGTSKKAFKQALGALFRERRIRFVRQGVELAKEPSAPRARRP